MFFRFFIFRRLLVPAALFLLSLSFVATAGAQLESGIVEEDLEEDVLEEDLNDPLAPDADGTARTELDEEVVQALFSEAEGLLVDDPGSAMLLFGQLVDLFDNHLARAEARAFLATEKERLAREAEAADPTAGEGTMPEEPGDEEATAEESALEEPQPPLADPAIRFLSPTLRTLYTRTLAYRAQVQSLFGEPEAALQGLERLLSVDPGADLDRDQAPQDLLKAFDSLRRKRIAHVVLIPEPPDPVIRVQGRPVTSFEDPVPVLSGSVWIETERPGYAPWSEEIEIRPGKTRSVEMVLERQSPVIRLYTRPSGSTVWVDGQERGVTEGIAPPDFLPQTSTVRYRSEEFSDELVIDGLETGLQILEVRKEGYRPYRVELVLDELLDYPMPPIVLEEERGVLALNDLPPDAELLINGKPMAVDQPGARSSRISLPPGEYDVQVASGSQRMFSTRLRLADRQTVEINVRLRPGLAFLGVIGGSASDAASREASLQTALSRTDKWALLDRTEQGPRALLEAGATAELLTAGALDEIDWSRVQAAVDRKAPGLLYLVAVLSDDLVDRRKSQVLLFPSAPLPVPEPDQLVIDRGDARSLEALVASLSPDLPLATPWLGARLIESRLAPHPVVAAVSPGSPAEAADLRVGDQVVALAGTPTFAPRDVEQRLAAAEVGEILDLGVQSLTGPRTLELRVRTSPAVDLPRNLEIPTAVALVELGLLRESTDPGRRWLVLLQQAGLLMQAGDFEAAVRSLQSIDAPQASHGFGQSSVDYWLGLALSRAGGEYLQGARSAFERAAELPSSRFLEHDGPALAPRARARLTALREGS